MRHAAASVLLANGVPMPIVSDIMGHSSITVTVDMYGHMSPSQVAEQMRRGMAGYGSA
jgi:site-specific recombinase XerD